MHERFFSAVYTAAGMERLRADGAAARVQVVTDAAASVGGEVVASRFDASDDGIAIMALMRFPDYGSAMAFKLAIEGGGLLEQVELTRVLTAEQLDEVFAASVNY